AMASAKLELLHITYVDSIRTILEEKNLEVLKIICFHTEGPAVLGPVGKQISLLGDLAVTSSGQNNIEVNHKNAQAMGNAEIEVKDYAKYTTDTNLESGVGKAILRAIAEDL
uniref:HAD hydrolase family protein n=1 Tax=Enterococcus lactis TaxID=357441 RepID=UPI002FD86D11